MQTRRTSILVDPDLLARVERHARRSGMTKTALIGAALRSYLEAAEAEGRPELPFLAVGRSGHGRLSLDGKRMAGPERRMR
ncbi:MAG TPA: CopG family transcriptional regulator [Candidatus Limnocylindrales bacterium]|jgi:hypothetical protein|nr:CopG family transcriptional regulator [Candidatus Limnocylindrales bacterium]